MRQRPPPVSITSKHLSFLSGCLERSGFKQHSSSMDAKMEGVMLPLEWQWNFALSSVAAKDLVRSICPKSVCVWLHCLSVPYKPKKHFHRSSFPNLLHARVQALEGHNNPWWKGFSSHRHPSADSYMFKRSDSSGSCCFATICMCSDTSREAVRTRAEALLVADQDTV